MHGYAQLSLYSIINSQLQFNDNESIEANIFKFKRQKAQSEQEALNQQKVKHHKDNFEPEYTMIRVKRI